MESRGLSKSYDLLSERHPSSSGVSHRSTIITAKSFLRRYFSENNETDESRDLWVKIMKNMGRCYFKLQEFGKSIEKFNEILSSEPNNLSVLDLKVC